MTFDLLSAAIKQLRERIPKEVNRATKEVAKVILQTAAENTPVDTTKALSNWQVGVPNRPLGVVGPRVPGLGGVTKQASLLATVRTGESSMRGRQVGQDIHIANNAEYIDGLNDGSISLKPDQFVQKAKLKGHAQISKTKLRLT